MRVIVVKDYLVDSLDQLVEECGAVGLFVVAGVVGLALEGGAELDGGLEVAAGLAGGFHAAVELDWAGAQAVAEHPGVGLAAQPGHAGGLVVGVPGSAKLPLDLPPERRGHRSCV
jgi:hypothetical protein